MAGDAWEEREKMRSSRVITVLLGMDCNLRVTVNPVAHLSLKFSKPRTMFHTGQSS